MRTGFTHEIYEVPDTISLYTTHTTHTTNPTRAAYIDDGSRLQLATSKYKYIMTV